MGRPITSGRNLVNLNQGQVPAPVAKVTSTLQMVTTARETIASMKQLWTDSRLKRLGFRYNLQVSSHKASNHFQKLLVWISANVDRSTASDLTGIGIYREVSELSFIPSSDEVYYIKISGCPTAITLCEGDIPSSSNSRTSNLSNDVITIHCKSLDDREKVIKFISKLGTSRTPRIHIPTAYDSWKSRQEVPLRSFDSVVLSPGTKEELIHDVEMFLESESAYLDYGIPWHRGYLFYGEPGTGKSSAAMALAERFGLSVYYLPLGDIKNDADLIELFSDVPPRAILLLEDVDVYKKNIDRDKGADSASLSSLLNSMDGIMTPHGLITVMTTNDIDALDPALIRPGRIDYRKEFGRVSLSDIHENFYGLDHGSTPDLPGDLNVNPSEVIGLLKLHINRPEDGKKAILNALDDGSLQ